MNRYQQIKGIIEALEEDFTKFYEKGNKAAGTRIRKEMQNLKNISTEIRKEVQNIKNLAENQANKDKPNPQKTDKSKK